jgi:hypothetical protein
MKTKAFCIKEGILKYSFLILKLKLKWKTFTMKIICALFFSVSASFMFLGSIDYTFGAITPVDDENASKLAPCLLKLSEKYFKSKRASRGSLVVVNLVPSPKSFFQRRVLKAINEDKKHAFGLMVKDGRLKHLNASAWGVTDKAKSYMLLMIIFEDLVYAIKQWKSLPTWNPLAQTVVAFMEPILTIEEKNTTVKKVLDILLSEGMINAIALYQMKDDDKRMIAETWFPYDGLSCATIVENIHKIDECIVSEEKDEITNERNITVNSFNEDKFPRIGLTFHGCQINICKNYV